MEAWTQTENVDLAAAFRHLGFPLRTDITTDEQSGRRWRKVLIAARNVPLNAFCQVGALQASVLRRALSDREKPLWKIDPDHPLVDILFTFQNRRRLLDAMHTGAHYRLNKACVLEPGDELPSIVNGAALFKTGDIDMAAALTRLGFRLAKITGTPPSCDLFFADPKKQAIDLVRLYRARRMDPENAFHVRLVSLMNGLGVRQNVNAYVTNREQQILIRAPRSRMLRSSLIPESADNKTLDLVRAHLRIG